MKNNQNRSVGIGIGAAVSGIFLFVLAKLGCCGLPVLVAMLGALGVSGSFLTKLEPLRPLFIILAICGVAYSFFKVYGPRRQGCTCAPSTFTKITVWTSALLVVGMLSYLAVQSYKAKTSACGCAKQNVQDSQHN
jgi:membrane-bound ClpP family serine protease